MIDFGLAFTVILTGLVVVFSALIGLTFLIFLLGKIMTAITAPKQPKATPPAKPVAPKAEPVKPSAPAQMIVEDTEEEVVAAITAAIMAMSGSNNFTIKSIRRISSRPVWGFAGMQENTRAF